MKLVLLSDPHVTEGVRIFGRLPLDCLRRALAHVEANHRDAELCLLLGDATGAGREGEYRLLKAALDDFALPTAMLIGNHDDRANCKRVFGTVGCDRQGFLQSEVRAGDFRCLLLDSNEPGEAAGSLGGGRLAWLETRLTESDLPCLLFVHHPPIPTGLPAFEAAGLKDRAALAELLAGHREKVRGIFFGHCHMSIAGSVAGIPAFGIRSLLYQALPNFADARFFDAPGLPPAYGLVLVQGRDLTVHSIEFGYDGPVEATGPASA